MQFRNITVTLVVEAPAAMTADDIVEHIIHSLDRESRTSSGPYPRPAIVVQFGAASVGVTAAARRAGADPSSWEG